LILLGAIGVAIEKRPYLSIDGGVFLDGTHAGATKDVGVH